LRASRAERGLEGLPPVLTFQSVIDFTVSTPAIVRRLYASLPDNGGSELVLFDVNRRAWASDRSGVNAGACQALARAAGELQADDDRQ
jgi:hypothetical protein